ncbi:hypothetical protein HMI54_011059 [Coelomomyces lativittatus]|nr:hypothetical protein HMI54_011059 [Coelomomyces lativittatus]KAJ1506105.1 hypothetical protein HMI56_000761 [Coelomomyces lativittatus]
MVFHMNSHTGARPFQCPLCDKRFSTVPNYRTHTKNVHHSNSLKYLYIDYDPVCSPHQQLSATANNTGKKYKTIVKPESTLSLRSSVESSSTNLNSPSPSPSPSLSPSSPLSLSPPLSFNASKSRSKPSTRHNSKLKSITPNTPIFSTPPPSSIPLPASSRVPLKRIEKSKPSSIHPITIPNTLPEIKARLLELNDQLQGLLGKTAHFQVSTTLVTSLQELEKQCKLTLNKLSPFTSTTTNLSSFPLKSN